MSRVLIIGNGFDIYHGLPTRYNDFLFLAEHWNDFYEAYSTSTATGDKEEQISVRLDCGKLSAESFGDYAEQRCVFDDEHIQYLNDHITSNAWIKYFLDVRFSGKGWVDFEAEIKDVLEAIDLFFDVLPRVAETKQPVINSSFLNSDIKRKVRAFLSLASDKFNGGLWGVLSRSDVEAPKLLAHRLYLIDKLKEEMAVLNECLRLYLLDFVEAIKSDVYSEQVKELGDVYLLNFNYTYTYKKIYGNLRQSHHPIHGDCLNGGMVLGIPDDSFRDKLEYIYFVKYFQRIQKRAGSFYKEWIRQPDPRTQTLSDTPVEAYIVGHSLADTDKGVLDDFFRNRWVSRITIFYHNQQAYEDMVINLVSMYGKDFVIEQTGNGRIIFEQLKDSVSCLEHGKRESDGHCGEVSS